jgi:hypothetical protein
LEVVIVRNVVKAAGEGWEATIAIKREKRRTANIPVGNCNRILLGVLS